METSAKNNRQNRSLKLYSQLWHRYLKVSGSYQFIGKNMLRLIVMLAAFAAGTWLFSTYVFDVTRATEFIFSHFPNWMVVSTLFISESFTGLLPPDLFILWAKNMPLSYAVVLILAICSYLGGLISWYIGTQLYKIPRIREWIEVKFKEQVKSFKKFGGLVIFISALTPLPFSPISIVSGMVLYPAKKYLLVASSRFVRFFLYAYVFFQVLS